jgi:hypothetical protein
MIGNLQITPAAFLAATLSLFTACSAASSAGNSQPVAGPGYMVQTNAGNGSEAATPGLTGLGGFTGNGVQPIAGSGNTPIVTTTTDPNNSEQCVGINQTAAPAKMGKVDIIWAIDASGSMWNEAITVSDNINNFANDIGNAAIDYRVVIVTPTDLVPAGTPLATAGRYQFVAAKVDSNNSLDILRDTFSQYQPFLRPDAMTHFVVLTDDESKYNGLSSATERAQAFSVDMQALLHKTFYLHAIASEDVGGGLPCMGDADSCLLGLTIPGVCGATAPGVTYYELAKNTGGLTVSVCITDWSQVFGPLKQVVVESVPLPCNYLIPPPPSGGSLDADKVNVKYLDSAGGEQLFAKAGAFEACADNLAWYYDNADSPKEVLLCQKACDAVAAGGTVNITFGCATVVLK